MIKIKKLIAGLLTAVIALLTIISPSLAIMTKETCVNDTTLLLTQNYTLETNGVPVEYGYVQYHECTNGCSNNKCQDPSILNLQTFALFFAIPSFFLILSKIFDDRIFSLISGLTFILLGVIVIANGIVLTDYLVKDTFINGLGVTIVGLGIFISYKGWVGND